MASQVSGVIEYIQPGGSSGTAYAIASTAYGYCETAAGTAAKVVDMANFKLYKGVTIHVKFANANSADNPTLNVNSTGAKAIVQYGTTAAGKTSETNGWYAGAVLTLTYDGTSWVRDQGFNTNSITNHTHNTQELYRPTQLNGVNDVTYQALINDVRANRLAFLPADQIIIEKTTDGGITWEDAGIPDGTKTALFSETRPGVYIPKINNEINTNCGLRITITAMKYDVPAGTPETQKYNYWNSSYVKSTERYNQIKLMYFWVSTANNALKVTVQKATGANPNSWTNVFLNNNYGMTGWSGNDIITFGQGVFGGGTTQTGNTWNWRITLMTCGPNGSDTLTQSSLTSTMVVSEIRGYGDTWWTAGNKYAASDHLYSWDYNKNATFPANLTATKFIGPLQGNADTATSATTASKAAAANLTTTTNSLAFYTNTTGTFGNAEYVKYLNHAAAATGAAGNIDGLLITGAAKGNATDLLSGTAGQLSYGDAGPQIRFNSSGQLGAMIFDEYDSTSGMGASFHFVSNTGSTAVKTDGLIARTRAIFGKNSIDTNYVLYSNGASYINGSLTVTGNIRRYYSTANTEPMITMLSNDQDIILWEAGHGTAAVATTTSNHYKLLYKGTGSDSTNSNYLQLIAHKSSDIIAVQIDEIGKIVLPQMAIGSATTPIYINSDGVITAGDALKDLAYISKGTGTTKFLREDGTWQVPAYPTWSSLGGGNSGKHDDSYFVKAVTSTDNAIVRFDGTSGQVQNSGVTIDDSNNVNTPGAIYTGGWIYSKKASPGVMVADTNDTRTDTSFRMNLTISANGEHGLWSSGYSNSDKTNFTSSAKWMIYRDNNGNILLNGNASTATKVAAKLAATTQTYLLGTSTTITGTAANVDLIGDTGVYLTTTSGQINATSYKVNEKVTLQWNSTDSSLDFIFA